MIVGVGIDVCDVARLGERLESTPGLRERLFTEGERDLPLTNLAGRFAVKESVAKALGSPGDLRWQEAEVVRLESGQPELVVTGSCALRAEALGGTHWHVSISHDEGIATAIVLLEAR